MSIYPEIWAGPGRNYRKDSSGNPIITVKSYITIHNTSNDATAEGEASYARRRTDGVSSHYYCDHDSILQSLDTDWRAAHVGSTTGNNKGISYEITGFNGWTRERWLASVAWDLLAACIARDCSQHGIAVRHLTVAEMKAGQLTGFITHDQARLAWGATTHTDPGPGFPMDHLIALVQQHLGGTGDDDVDAKTLDLIAGNAWRTHTVIRNEPTVPGGPTQGERNELHFALKALQDRVDSLAAGVDLDALAERVAAKVSAREADADRARAEVLDGATPPTA